MAAVDVYDDCDIGPYHGQHPVRLSACVIAWDEEPSLRACLESLNYPGTGAPLYDELVVVLDDRTQDATAAIAASFGARIVPRAWDDDFAAARNFAESQARGEYVLWIDADERLESGHDLIHQIVAAGELDGVRPICRPADASSGEQHIRQELLHRRTMHTWRGKVHEWLEGPTGPVRTEIVYRELGRVVDRPHGPGGDVYVSLRANFGDGIGQRDCFYLAREHLHDRHYHECIAVVDLLLAQPPTDPPNPIERSNACLFKGMAYEQLGRTQEARRAYIDALTEWSQWAEPWMMLGNLLVRLEVWHEAAAHFHAATYFPQVQYAFSSDDTYNRVRYQNLAICLTKLRRYDEARRWLDVAEAKSPGHALLSTIRAAIDDEERQRTAGEDAIRQAVEEAVA